MFFALPQKSKIHQTLAALALYFFFGWRVKMNDTQRRILTGLEYIEANLDKAISLEDVARRAAFSMYHFHRVFKAIVGIPVGEYIRRRRLTLAAQRLATSQERILDIALESQFESQESFTRAFKQMYGVAPGIFRKKSQPSLVSAFPRVTEQLLQSLSKGTTMEPKVVQRPALHVAGLSSRYKQQTRHNIPLLWERFIGQLAQVKRVNQETYGIFEGAESCEGASEVEIIYLAATQVSEDAALPKGWERKSLPGGSYLVFTHKGPISKIRETIDYIWGVWLPQSRHIRREAPDFELYDERFKMEDPESEVDLYIPIEEKVTSPK